VFEINKETIKRWRLRLAALIAPAGAHVHDAEEISCFAVGPILNAVFWGDLAADARGRQRMDVTTELDSLYGAGLIEHPGAGPLTLTSKGEKELARVWGPSVAKPRGGGTFECSQHGEYEVRPGHLFGCPGCLIEKAVQSAVR
jgi:hypothetical protein